MKRFAKFLGSTACALAFGFGGGQAIAQTPDATSVEADPSTPAEAAEEGDNGLGEIIVTARRRSERLQDVPIAITALGGDQLAERGVVVLQDIQQQAPGFSIPSHAWGRNQPSFSIRGQRQFLPYMTADPSVAVYFADIIQARSQGVNQALFDIDTVQVLKGPQGTLFGRNSTGGAVVITPAAPEFDAISGYGRLTIGNYNLRQAEAAINLPVNDTLALRFGGQITRRRGYSLNLFDGRHFEDANNESWRASLRWAPTDNFENRLVVAGFHADENGSAYRAAFLRAGTQAGNFPGAADSFALLQNSPFHTINVNQISPGFRGRTFMISNITEVGVGEITVKNIAGYRRVRSIQNIDLDGLPQTIFPTSDDLRARQLSNEFQILGNSFNNSLNWIVGAFIFHETGTESQASIALGQGRRSLGDVENMSASVFAQATYRPPSLDAVSVTAGLRYSYDDRRFVSRADNQLTGACRLTNTDGTIFTRCELPLQASFDEPTYTLAADWKVTDDVLLYVTRRRGYRAGGFNFQGNLVPQFIPFRPEIVTDNEIGIKADWRLGALTGRTNVALYRDNYSNVQRSTSFVLNNVFYTSILNAAVGRIQGLEFDQELRIGRYLSVRGTYALIDAEYLEYFDGAGRDLSATPFGGTPRHQVSASVRYEVPLGNMGELAILGSYYYQSSSWYNDPVLNAQNQPTPTTRLNAYDLVNGRIEWSDIGGSRFSAAFWVKNLLDNEYYQAGTDLGPTVGVTGLVVGDPRTFGLDLTFRF
jgi:iron complex outermembrane receptor protein